MTTSPKATLTQVDLAAIETPADHYAELGAAQIMINDLIDEGCLLLEDAEGGHKRVLVCAIQSCGLRVRIEACHSRTLECRRERLLERREDGALFRVFHTSHEPEAYEGPTEVDGRGWGTELTPRRKG